MDPVDELRRLQEQGGHAYEPGTFGLRVAWSGYDPSSPLESVRVKARLDPSYEQSVISQGLMAKLVYTTKPNRGTEVLARVERRWGREFMLVRVAVQVEDRRIPEVETVLAEGELGGCQMVVGQDILCQGVVPLNVILRFRDHLQNNPVD